MMYNIFMFYESDIFMCSSARCVKEWHNFQIVNADMLNIAWYFTQRLLHP